MLISDNIALLNKAERQETLIFRVTEREVSTPGHDTALSHLLPAYMRSVFYYTH
jgi:hypothetical protein